MSTRFSPCPSVQLKKQRQKGPAKSLPANRLRNKISRSKCDRQRDNDGYEIPGQKHPPFASLSGSAAVPVDGLTWSAAIPVGGLT